MHFKEPKEKFDEFRNDYFGAENPAGVRQLEQLADEYNVKLIAPYLDRRVRDYMMQHDWYYFNKPVQKAPIREAFPEIQKIKKRNHENLQLVAGIPEYFEKLLDNKDLNCYSRERVIDLVRDWQDVRSTLEEFF